MAKAITPMNLNPSTTAIGAVVCVAIALILFIAEWLVTTIKKGRQ